MSTVSHTIDKRIRIACLGDSITAGYGLSDPLNNSYPAVLQQLLGGSYYVRNFGANGATVLHNSPASYIMTEEWFNARDFAPDIIVSELGANDLIPGNIDRFEDDFIEDYLELIDGVTKLSSDVRVFITSLTPINVVFRERPDFLGTWYSRIQNMISVTAKRQAATLIDIVAPMKDALNRGVSLFPDGIHPNDLGANIIAHRVFESLSEHLKL